MGKDRTFRFYRDGAGKKEAIKYAYLYQSISDPILQQRAKGSLHYFIHKAAYYKRMWMVLSSLSIAFPSISTYIVALNLAHQLTSFLISSISMLTSLVTGYLALFKCADKKIFYRDAAEGLKSEISRYLTATEEYEDCADDAQMDRLFSKNLERLVKSSNHKIVVLEREQQSLPSK